MGIYNPDGSWKVTVVGQNDPPHSLYAPDGSYRVTTDVGTGLYAPNGSYRIGTDLTRGYYTQPGAINGVLVGSQFFHAPLWISGAPELAVNGDFTNDIVGWQNLSTPAGTVTWSAGQLRLERTDAGNARTAPLVPIAVTPGKLHRLTIKRLTFVSTMQTAIGTTPTGVEVMSLVDSNAAQVDYYFVPTTNAIYPNIRTININVVMIDSVSVKRVT